MLVQILHSQFDVCCRRGFVYENQFNIQFLMNVYLHVLLIKELKKFDRSKRNCPFALPIISACDFLPGSPRRFIDALSRSTTIQPFPNHLRSWGEVVEPFPSPGKLTLPFDPRAPGRTKPTTPHPCERGSRSARPYISYFRRRR